MVRAVQLASIILCVALICPGVVFCGQPKARIAFIIDASQAMGEPWLGTTRLSACLEAVAIELKSLPLRATAAVWLATTDGPELLIAPTEADGLNHARLTATANGRQPLLEPNIIPAMRWAAEGKPGAVIIVGLPLGGSPITVPVNWPFVHGLLVGPTGQDTGLQGPLTIQTGGRLLGETDPRRVQMALHKLVRLGISRFSLYADVRDADNQPLSLELQIASANDKQNTRPVLSNKEAQVLAKTYVVTWPSGNKIGPGTPPPLVRIGETGRTVLRAGGQGKLFIEALDATGKTLPWKITISTVLTGTLLAYKVDLPLEMDLPAGRMLISVAKPPVSWTVDLAAKEARHLVLGPRSKLTALLAGPGGQVRVPLTATGPDASTRQWRGHTGSPLPLPPGNYKLLVQTIPPLIRSCQIAPGTDQTVDFPTVGGLLVRHGNTITPQRYDVLDSEDQSLGSGHTGRMLFLLPGRYMAVLPGGKSLAVEVSPGRLTTLETK